MPRSLDPQAEGLLAGGMGDLPETPEGENRAVTFKSPDDPYGDRKKYHMADKFGPGGAVSALCFKRPRAIRLSDATWTLQPEAVTCVKCKRILSRRGKQ